MEDICLTPNIDIKTVEINENGNIYKCKIQIIKDFIQVILFMNDNIKQEGRIHLSQIHSQLCIYNYNINEIFEEINILNNNNFNIIKEDNKYSLKIEFIILRKKKYLIIDLIKNKINNNDLIQTITELKEIIKSKDNEIQLLKEKLNQYQLNNINDNTYNNFNIKLKEPIHKLKYHTSCINCSTVLNDGRFVTGSI